MSWLLGSSNSGSELLGASFKFKFIKLNLFNYNQKIF